jgi:hypothetical protein
MRNKMSFFLLFFLFSFLSCENPVGVGGGSNHPFKAGLGPAIDLQGPVIVLVTPEPSSYISGVTEFTGYAKDDIKLASVWFQLANYKDVELTGFRVLDHELGRFYRISETSGSNIEWNWKFRIDTRGFPDGDFMIRLLVIDEATKQYATDEIMFYIKNDIPQISLGLPSVLPGSEPGDLGSGKLNYGFIADKSGAFPRVMDTGSWIMGTISDSEGIYRGPRTGDIFPPQIRFWQVDPDMGEGAFDLGGEFPVYPTGVLPPEDKVPWKDIIKLKEIDVRLPTLHFTYDLPEITGAYFGFEIRAQSSDKDHSTARYPVDYLGGVNYYEQDEAFKRENGYALILLRTPQEFPILQLYQFEALYEEGGLFGKRQV